MEKIDMPAIQIKELASNGYSINQASRLLKMRNDLLLRRYLEHPDNAELLAQFKENGLKRKHQGRRT